MNRRPSALIALALAASLSFGLDAAPASAAQRSASVAAISTVPAPPDTINDFLPVEENIGTCIGTLERPGCGSKAKGDFRQYLTFAVLLLGMAFIGWRITLGVRKRDRELTKPPGNTF